MDNSGAAAISVAVHTGAKRVILLGFDMSLGDIKTSIGTMFMKEVLL